MKKISKKDILRYKEVQKTKRIIRKRNFQTFLEDIYNALKKKSVLIKALLIIVGVGAGIHRVFFVDSSSVLASKYDVGLVIVGALLTIIQIGDARRLQEASFLIDLNKTFVENETYTKMYEHLENNRKGIKNEEKLKSYEVSQYLTFFETLYILVRDHATDIDDFDDLFAYRFFLAINDDEVWDLKLKHENNFKNIYELERRWFNYRAAHGIQILGKKYNINDPTILEAKKIAYNIRYNDLTIKKANSKTVDEILNFQEEIFSTLVDSNLLRRNDEEMFKKCVQDPNITYCLYNRDLLVGIIIMYALKDEDLSNSLLKHKVVNSANFKLIMVRDEYRGNKLMMSLMWVLERYASLNGYTHLCATASEDNSYSFINMLSAGYEYDSSQIKYGTLKRDIYVKDIRKDQKDYKNSILKVYDLKDIKDQCFLGEKDIVNYGDIVELKSKDKKLGIVLENNKVKFEDDSVEDLDKIKNANYWIATRKIWKSF